MSVNENSCRRQDVLVNVDKVEWRQKTRELIQWNQARILLHPSTRLSNICSINGSMGLCQL